MTKQSARKLEEERLEIVAIVTLEEARAAVLDTWFAGRSLPLYLDETLESIEEPGPETVTTFEL